MHEILIDGAEIFAPHQRVHQVFAHRHERRRSAGCQVEPPEQLLTARLGRDMKISRRFVGTGARPRVDGRIDALAWALQARGVGPGALVGLCLGRSTSLVAAMLGGSGLRVCLPAASALDRTG